MRSINKYLAVLAVLPVLVFPAVGLAQFEPGIEGAKTNLEGIETTADVEADLPHLIGTLINAFLGVLGIVLVILIIYAGIRWMTAMGDKTKVEEARTLIIQAVVGMIIVIAAYSIAKFVVDIVASSVA